jgi:Lysozyme like domain
VRRWAAAAGALLLLPVVVIGAAVGAVLPSVDGAPIRAGGALGLAAAAGQAGFAGQALRMAVAVGLAESGGNSRARHRNPPTPGCPAGSVDRGGWQLNSCYHPEVSDGCADDLGCAAHAAYRISQAGSDWTPWTTYTSGAYLAQLAAADRAIAALLDPGGCGLSPAAEAARRLVVERFGITDIQGCDPDFRGHIQGSDHYPDASGQAHAIDVMVGDDTALGWQVAGWAAANAAALKVKYVIFAGHIIDFRAPTPLWHPCRDPTSSCATGHARHVHLSFTA